MTPPQPADDLLPGVSAPGASVPATAGETSVAVPRIVLVGNPNVGKSVLFGFLTKRYVTVSNYPGTTVTVTRGRAVLDGTAVEVLDSPGINSLVPMSEDEEVTRDILLDGAPTAILQVADAKNLRRALILTSQLAEMDLPFALDLNMNDEAAALGIRIDRGRLEELLGRARRAHGGDAPQGIGRAAAGAAWPAAQPLSGEVPGTRSRPR